MFCSVDSFTGRRSGRRLELCAHDFLLAVSRSLLTFETCLKVRLRSRDLMVAVLLSNETDRVGSIECGVLSGWRHEFEQALDLAESLRLLLLAHRLEARSMLGSGSLLCSVGRLACCRHRRRLELCAQDLLLAVSRSLMMLEARLKLFLSTTNLVIGLLLRHPAQLVCHVVRRVVSAVRHEFEQALDLAESLRLLLLAHRLEARSMLGSGSLLCSVGRLACCRHRRRLELCAQDLLLAVKRVLSCLVARVKVVACAFNRRISVLFSSTP